MLSDSPSALLVIVQEFQIEVLVQAGSWKVNRTRLEDEERNA